MNDTSLPLLLARWFDDRLHDSVGFCLTGCRLYGLELIDDDALRHGEPTAVRAAFLVEGADRETVVRDPSAPRRVDASRQSVGRGRSRDRGTKQRPVPRQHSTRQHDGCSASRNRDRGDQGP